MSSLNGTATQPAASALARHPIAILGVPFDNISTSDTLRRLEEMLTATEPQYVVTANVDFLAQAQNDVELRRILFDAHLVLCDGTPLLWASRLLGNPLAERVAGSDLVPLLIETAARKRHRLFFLGSTPEAGTKALSNLKERYPALQVAHYSPPFSKLLEMDHQEITKRIREFRPDALLVSFGCPKQEKWIAMHYRSLGVPVSIGVGATIDFLAGQVRRAPRWMQNCGLEWVFRLMQEPRRLFGRYAHDLWFFGAGIASQWWTMRSTPPVAASHPSPPAHAGTDERAEPIKTVKLPPRFDLPTVAAGSLRTTEILNSGKDCIVDASSVEFIDSSGIGALIGLNKQLRKAGQRLFLLRPTKCVRQALVLMRLIDFFNICENEDAMAAVLSPADTAGKAMETPASPDTLRWTGEITAATVPHFREQSQAFLETTATSTVYIDMGSVRFIDSSGLGLMLGVNKEADRRGVRLHFTNLQPAVRNVLRLAHLEKFFAPAPVPIHRLNKPLVPALS